MERILKYKFSIELQQNNNEDYNDNESILFNDKNDQFSNSENDNKKQLNELELKPKYRVIEILGYLPDDIKKIY